MKASKVHSSSTASPIAKAVATPATLITGITDIKSALQPFAESMTPEMQAGFAGVPLHRQGIRLVRHGSKRDGRAMLELDVTLKCAEKYSDEYRCVLAHGL
jgi:hypothetical protein